MLNKTNKMMLILACMLVLVAIATIASAQDDWGAFGDNTDAGAFLGLGLAVCAVVCIIWFIIALLIAIWVYRDAEKRGSSGVLWLIIVILTSWVGIIIWLIVRPPIGGAPVQQVQQPQQPAPGRACPNCGRAIPMDARVCPYCAKKFEE